MGLIGSWLGALYSGGCGVYMSPVSFLRNPPLWLEAISRYGGTHTQAPNFSLRLVTRKFRALKDRAPQLDLSTMRHFFNAAEPVHGADIDAFLSTFKPHGFPEQVRDRAT